MLPAAMDTAEVKLSSAAIANSPPDHETAFHLSHAPVPQRQKISAAPPALQQ